MLTSLYFGYDRDCFYIRIDGIQDLFRLLRETDILNLHLGGAREYRVPMQLRYDEGLLQIKENSVWEPMRGRCYWKIARICEVSIPLTALRLQPKGKLFASVSLIRDNEEIGRWPSDAPLMLYYAGPDIEVENWLI
jgi:hypothetical protein